MIDSLPHFKSLLLYLFLVSIFCQSSIQAQTSLSGSTFVQSLSTTNTPTGITLSPDGLTMVISDNTTNSIIEYDLSTAFDVSTATTSGNSIATTSFNGVSFDGYSPTDLKFVNSGSSLIAVGESVDGSFTQYVYLYGLSTAYDITTAGTPENTTLSSETWVTGVAMNATGDAFYISDRQNDEVVPYTLTTAFTLGTPSRGTPVSIAANIDDAQALQFSDDGSTLFIVDQDASPDFTGSIWTFTLSSGYHVSDLASLTPVEELTFDIASQGLAILNDASKLFVIGDNATTDFFYEYDIPEADTEAPIGYTVVFDDDIYNANDVSSTSFTINGGEINATYNYVIFDESGGTFPASGTNSGTMTTASQQVTGLNLSSLADGTLTISLTLTDEAENEGSATTATTIKDTEAPSGYTVSFDDDTYSASEESSASFTISGGEANATFEYTVTDEDSGELTGSGTITTTTSQQITGLDLSSLADGTLTLSITLTDEVSNEGAATTATSSKDSEAPNGYTVAFDDDIYSASEGSSASFTISEGEANATFEYTITDEGSGELTGSGTITTTSQQVSDLDLSSFADGTLTLSITLTDEAANEGAAVTATSSKDTEAPSGYTVSFDDETINAEEAPTATFTVTDGEVGATYSFGILDENFGSVTSSGTLNTTTEQFEVDLSGLSDGELTLSFALTDAAGNSGDAVTAMATLDLTAPTVSSVEAKDDESNMISATNGADFTFSATFSESITGFDEDDFTVTNADVVSTTTSGSTSSVEVSPRGDGDIIFSATGEVSDIAGNTLTLDNSLTVTYDATNPTATVTATITSPTNTSPIPFELSFSETISGFDLSDASQITISNGALTQNEDGSYFTEATEGTTYTFTVTPSADGTVSVTVPAGIVTDIANNTNPASEALSIDYDRTSPQANITFPDLDGPITNTSPITVAITFDEAVFQPGSTSAWDGSTGLSIVNGEIDDGSFTSTSNAAYSFSITPDSEGVISIDLANSVVVDEAGNSNAAKSAEVRYDLSGPKIESFSPASGGTVAEPFTLIITFDEEVTGFSASEDLTITNGTLGEANATEGQTFEMTLTPTDQGLITVSLVAEAVSDQFGQTNEAAESFFEITYDIPFSGGSGTEEDPFLIAVLEDLQLLSEDRSYWSESYHFQQTANITFEHSFTFKKIGIENDKFSGTYDGGGFEITDLVIRMTDDARDFGLGFFGYVEVAEIKNLTLTNISVVSTDDDVQGGFDFFGQAAFVGIANDLTITSCHVSGEIKSEFKAFNFTGGIVGISGSDERPGNLTIRNCRNSASISGRLVNAGIVALVLNSSVSITNCVNTGSIVADGAISGISGGWVSSFGEIRNSYNLGHLGGTVITGIFGLLRQEGASALSVDNCYNAGTFALSDPDESSAHPIGPNPLDELVTHTINNCLYDEEIYTLGSPDSEGRTGLTTAQLQDPDHLTSVHGWDFICETANGEEDIWTIPDLNNAGYPALSWEHPDQDCNDILNSPIAEPAAISVYPNPTSGIVHLQSISSVIESIAIYNASGKVVNTISPSVGGEHMLDLSDQKAGLYFIQVVESSKSKTFKVIVEK